MTLTRWLGVVAFLLSGYIIWQMKDLVILIFAAVICANALNILVQVFRRYRFQRGYAVFFAISLALFTFVGVFWLIIPPVVAQLQELPEQFLLGSKQFPLWFNQIQHHLDPRLVKALPSLEEIITQIQPLINPLLGRGLNFFSNTVGGLLNLLLILILTLMLLADPQPYLHSFVRLFPAFYRSRIEEILTLCDRALQEWLEEMLFNIVAISILTFIGLSIIGIPFALSQAILAGVLTLIPHIGPALSLLPVLAIALLDHPWKIPLVIVLYLIIQFVESHFLTPRIIPTKQVTVMPAAILLSQLVFTIFLGVPGLLLSLPLTVVGKIWIHEIIIKDILDRSNTPPRKELLPTFPLTPEINNPIQDFTPPPELGE